MQRVLEWANKAQNECYVQLGWPEHKEETPRIYEGFLEIGSGGLQIGKTTALIDKAKFLLTCAKSVVIVVSTEAQANRIQRMFGSRDEVLVATPGRIEKVYGFGRFGKCLLADEVEYEKLMPVWDNIVVDYRAGWMNWNDQRRSYAELMNLKTKLSVQTTSSF